MHAICKASAELIHGPSQVYFVTLVSHACVLVMAVGFLIYLLQLKDYHPIIARIQGWLARPFRANGHGTGCLLTVVLRTASAGDRIPTVSEGGVTVAGA